MAKKKGITQEDLKRLFEDTKKRLQRLGKETGVWLKKGEAELSRLSKIGKLEINVVNLNIKKEKLFKEIGKRVVELNLWQKVDDRAIKNMSDKAKSIINESKKKKSVISKIGKGLLKRKTTTKKKR
jgi:hypothetical protein